jgi:regulatory protein
MAARRPAKAKAKPKATPSLMDVALTKLDYRDRTKKQLKELLTRKAAESGTDEAEVAEVLSRLESSGVINDQRFAEHYARSARGRGASSAKVQQKLGQKGIDRSGAERALGAVAEEGQDELAAAKRYAERRRLAQRYDLADPKERQKALASLARQGFSFNTALAVLGGRSDEDDVE